MLKCNEAGEYETILFHVSHLHCYHTYAWSSLIHPFSGGIT